MQRLILLIAATLVVSSFAPTRAVDGVLVAYKGPQDKYVPCAVFAEAGALSQIIQTGSDHGCKMEYAIKSKCNPSFASEINLGLLPDESGGEWLFVFYADGAVLFSKRADIAVGTEFIRGISKACPERTKEIEERILGRTWQ